MQVQVHRFFVGNRLPVLLMSLLMYISALSLSIHIKGFLS